MIRPFIDNHYQSRDVKFSSNKVLLYKVTKTKQRWGHLFLKKLNKNLKVFYLFKQIHDFTVARSAKNWLRLHIPSSDVTFAVVRLCSHIYLRRERSHSFTLAARTRQNFCNGYTDTDTDTDASSNNNKAYFLANIHTDRDRHRSVVSSAPTILRLQVQIPRTPFTLFSICIVEIIMRKGRK